MRTLQFHSFRLDTLNQCLWKLNDVGRKERVQLTPKAFAVLGYLVEHAGCLVKHGDLLEAEWPGINVQPQAVKKHVCLVRKALGDHRNTPLFIETVSKSGYRFIAPVSELTTSSVPANSAVATQERARINFRDKELLDLIYALEHHHTNPEGIYWIGRTLVECRSLLRGRGFIAQIPLVDAALITAPSGRRARLAKLRHRS
jgi:DNA-binding winged helix-turn-helix (wHTH) protein